jgi:two-component system, OmpR family, sensor kinase
VTSATPTRPEDEAAFEAQPVEQEAVPRAAEPAGEERGERRRQDRFGAVWSARTRILAAYVVLLALSAVFAMFAFRQSLLIRLDDQVGDELRQEVFEFDRLLTDGRDPTTGQPFTSLEALFDVYFLRNVPGRDEAMLAFVGGELYRQSTLGRFPLDRLPSEALAEWERRASPAPAEADSATGRYDTAQGEAHFRVERVNFGGQVGAFVVTILPTSERDEIAELQTYGVAAGLGILLIASAIAWFIAGRVLAPVRLLTETARSISQSDLTQRIAVRGTGEAAEMARSFNAMLDRLETVFRTQREFVQRIGHELRDPLTICRGHLELLGHDPEERQVTVPIVMDELDRMGRIVDDLQVLAEAEHPDFLQREWIDARLFAHELVAKASALDSRRWTLDLAPDGMFFGDRQRLTEALMNLAHNAVQHTEPDDTVAIGTSLTEEEARLWVRDSGSGVPVADQERIFNRFTRGTGAHRRYRGGGLGLAIVKAIAGAHGGRVELESRLGQGSTFTIVVPQEPIEGEGNGQDPDR